MPTATAKACIKCGRRIEEPGNTSFYHAACDPRPAQRAEHDRWRAEQPYRHLYNLRAWRDRTVPFILSRDPICRICNRAASTLVDHINDHKGDLQKFFNPNNLRGVCKPCHDERTGKEHGFGTASTPAPGGIAPGVATAQASVMGAPFKPNPTPATTPPPTFPVAPEHQSLPDGTVAMKREYARKYRKAGQLWILVAV
jgi:5-methylcytosine-specific restriction endonuclease McrA